MTYSFSSPMTAADLSAKVEAMKAEARLMEPLAKALTEFEAATGRALALVDAATDFAEASAPAAFIRHRDAPQDAQEGAEIAKSVNYAIAGAESRDGHSEASAAPLRAVAKRQRSAEWDALTATERRVVEHLEGLGEDFAPEDDLHLVDMLLKGNKVGTVSQFLEVSEADVLARWKAMVAHPEVRAANGKGASLNGQDRLLAAARYRATEAAQ